MGPTIILDKSALQSLPQRAVYELSTYFYTNITPVVLMEILADLRLDGKDMDRCRAIVSDMAHKVIPVDAATNVHFQPLCILDLLGGKVKMDRRAIVGGGQQVTSADGRKAFVVGVQPENEAVLRWLHGNFSEADLEFAANWRKTIEAANLEVEKRKLPRPMKPIKSLPELRGFVDTMLSHPDCQVDLLEHLMQLLRLQGDIRDCVRSRWRNNNHTSIKGFAPYAHHCLRVQLLFCFGISSGLLGTRNSNIVDVEYLYYTPFCRVFSSGDKFLQRMASLVLADDQSFVCRDDLRQTLDEVAVRREAASSVSAASPVQNPPVEPDENSLIQALWKKHHGRFVPQANREPVSRERSEQIMKELRPIMEAMNKASRERPHQRRFPV